MLAVVIAALGASGCGSREPSGATRLIGRPLVFRTYENGGLAYALVWRLDRDPLVKYTGAENRNHGRGEYSIGPFDAVDDGGVTRLGQTDCFLAGFDSPLPTEVRRYFARYRIGDRVLVELAPRASRHRATGGHHYSFQVPIRYAPTIDLTAPSARRALAALGC